MTVDVLSSQDHIALADRWGAHDSVPFPVVLTHGKGAWMTDLEGRRYLDFHGGTRRPTSATSTPTSSPRPGLSSTG